MARLVDTSSLKIDPEFRDYLPHGAWNGPKKARVEREILEEGGPREPLTVWKGTEIVVDGQHRYAICEKHGIQVTIVEREFSDRDAVKAFMRRRMLDDERGLNPAEYAIWVAEDLKAQKGAGVKGAADKAAEAAGVDRRTIYRQKSYGEALSSLHDDIRKRVVDGELKASRDTVIELAAFGQFHQLAIVAQFDRGDYASLADAIHGKGESKEKPDDVPAADPLDNLEPESPGESGKVSHSDERPAEKPKAADKPPSEKSTTDKPPRPSRKPVKEIFDEAQRQLAKVSQLLGQARGVTKREANYLDCMNKFGALSDAIEVWSKKSA